MLPWRKKVVPALVKGSSGEHDGVGASMYGSKAEVGDVLLETSSVYAVVRLFSDEVRSDVVTAKSG